MYQVTVNVEGMACSMCEAHVNEAVRKAVPGAKKVNSSHKKGRTEFLTEQPIDEAAVRSAIDATGYRVLEISTREAKKSGFRLPWG